MVLRLDTLGVPYLRLPLYDPRKMMVRRIPLFNRASIGAKTAPGIPDVSG